jgi:hypothetical protein
MPVRKITLSAAVEEVHLAPRAHRICPQRHRQRTHNLRALVRHVERTRTIQVRNLTSDHLFDFCSGDTVLRTEHPDRFGTMRKPINEATHNA